MVHVRMPRRRAPLLLRLVVIVAGIGVLLARTGADAAAQPAGPGGYAPLVELAGAVHTQRQLTLADLQARPAVWATHRCFDSDSGRVRDHAFRGVPLWNLLTEAGLAVPPGVSTVPAASLRASLIATGSDGYRALIALAEIDPAINGRPAVLAYERDGELLGADAGMAMLVLPDDPTCDRDVFWLTRLEVRFIDAPPRSESARCDAAIPTAFAAFFENTPSRGEARGPVSGESARAFLVWSGLPDSLALDFVASFAGPISARIVPPEESFFRYTADPTSRGSFLTKSLFAAPAEAVVALALSVTGNAATYRQTVTAMVCAIVLEGGIAGGGPIEIQTLAPNRDAFDYGQGMPYGPNNPDGRP